MTTDTKIEWVTVTDVAEAFDIHVATVYREIKAGRIPAKKIGGSIRITKEWLDSELAPFLSADRL